MPGSVGESPHASDVSFAVSNENSYCDLDNITAVVDWSTSPLDLSRIEDLLSIDSRPAELPTPSVISVGPAVAPSTSASSPLHSLDALPTHSELGSCCSGNNQDPLEVSKRRQFPCLNPMCNRHFTSEYTRRVHMQVHEPRPRRSFPCTMGCSERFSRKHDRVRHEVAKHERKCEWNCKRCQRFFCSKKTMAKHDCPGRLVVASRWTVSGSDKE